MPVCQISPVTQNPFILRRELFWAIQSAVPVRQIIPYNSIRCAWLLLRDIAIATAIQYDLVLLLLPLLLPRFIAIAIAQG